MDVSPARVRALGVALAALALSPFALVPACSTGAVGIDACRQIESARCEAAPACENGDPSFGIATEEQVDNCKVFYNDHCLVGLENTEAEPVQDDVNDCVAAVQAMAACQTAGAATLAECDAIDVDKVIDPDYPDITPCEALFRPWRTQPCAFVEKPDEDEDE
ncbi:MAG: hypothetical protein HOW73_30355 [Polyangiaceae bacterium]|nr:hypothetical protein [Polyangiaceae bacterium]